MKFSEMTYTRLDADEVKKEIAGLTEALRSAQTYEEARSLFLRKEDAEKHLTTQSTLAQIRHDIDTRDAFYDEECRYWNRVMPELEEYMQDWTRSMLESPFRGDFSSEFGDLMFVNAEIALKTFSPAIIPELQKENDLVLDYDKLIASAQIPFEDGVYTLSQLSPFKNDADDARRLTAWKAEGAWYKENQPELDRIYDELVHLRDGMAKKLGFKRYTDLAYLERRRFDYSQEDAANFRAQIKAVITPAVAEIREKQRKLLGVEKLHYYDEALIFPEGNADPIGTMDELVAKAQQMYREMSPETGEFFDFMVKYHLFDLETRPGKRMGGYMTRFPGYQAPFIFSNFNGTSADVDVLTHEAGHAFQGYLAMRSIPVSMLSGSTSEINEIHSMTMEHFAYPWMESFFEDKREDYITSHLIGAVAVLPYMCCVDEYQHRVYADVNMTAMERRAVWREIEKNYMPWRDYDGEEFLEGGGFWMQKQHIFLYPFYYIDYALAQMCAFQYYGRMKENRPQAWQDYLRLCRAGGQKGYFELLREGSLLNPFHEGTVEKSIGHVLEEIAGRY